MNSDEQSKVTDEPIDALAMIRNVVNKLGPTISEAAGSFKSLGRMQEPEKKKVSSTKNKSQKRNKVRFLMAKKSNRINRQRVKGWKY